MRLVILKHNLSIQDTSFLEMYSFKCGNTVPIYDIKSIYGLKLVTRNLQQKNMARSYIHERLIPFYSILDLLKTIYQASCMDNRII